MSELMLFVFLILLFTTFGDFNVITASLISLVSAGTYLSSIVNFYILSMINTIFPNVSLLPYILFSYEYINNLSIGIMIFIFIICFILCMVINHWLSNANNAILNSRRFHKTYGAMKIVYAMIFLSAAVILLQSGIAVSNYSTILIFIIALVAFFKFHIPPVILMIIAIIISYALY